VLGLPAHRDRRRARLHPAPVDARQQGIGDRAQLDLGGTRPPAKYSRQNSAPASKQRGVDRRQLDVAVALPGRHVEEVVVEAAVAGHAVRGVALLRRIAEEPQRRQHAGRVRRRATPSRARRRSRTR